MAEKVGDYPERGILHRFLSRSSCGFTEVQDDVPKHAGIFLGFALLGVLALTHASAVSLFVPDVGYDCLACAVGVLFSLIVCALWVSRQ